MGAELNGSLQNALGNGPANAGGHVVALDGGDDLVFDMLDDGHMGVKDGAGVHVQLVDAQSGDLLHDHIQHEVAVTQVMVEGNGHTVL